jgi:hypothetical protein
MVKLVGMSGSLRTGSLNSGLLRAAAELVPDGHKIEIASIRDIPLYDGDLEGPRGRAGPGALFGTQALEQSWPIIFVDGLWIISAFPAHLSASSLHGLDASRFDSASGSNAPTRCVRAIGLKGRADEPRFVPALQDDRACSIAPKKATGIIRISEPVNHFDTNE